MEADLARTRDAVAMLRDLLEHPDSEAPIKLRRVEATASAAISEVIDIADALHWYHGALGELDATLAGQGVSVTRPAGAIYATELFAEERGRATVFMATSEPVRPMGRVVPVVVPAAELATIVHAGSHSGIDRAYGALGSYVSEHSVGVDGPIHEYYLVGPNDKVNEDAYRTEIGWPIFRTALQL
jgi:effector-binding domain-containing protein